MKKGATEPDSPTLRQSLFWEYKQESIDWQRDYVFVLQRVFEWGKEEEWEELIRFYGKDKVLTALRTEILYLPDYSIEAVCSFFELGKEELVCYTRKLSRPGHWI